MSNYTFCSCIIAAADQAAMQALVGDGYFTAGYSPDGSPPATNYISSGAFDNNVLDTIVNSDIPKQVHFGMDLWTDGLVLVSEP